MGNRSKSLQRVFFRTLHKRSCKIALVVSVVALLVSVIYNSNTGDIVHFYLASGRPALPLSIQCNEGRLGNQMCTYATLYGLSALNNRRPFKTRPCNMNHLTPYFKGLSAPKGDFLYIEQNPWYISPYLKAQDAFIPLNSNFIKGYMYPCSYTFFDHVGDEIRREFHFADFVQQYAQIVLRKANTDQLENVTYVGVHVRRGDYKKAWLNKFGGVEVNIEFFRRAIEYFRGKYKPVVFIAVSDDRLWCIEHLASRFGLYVPEDAISPAHDLAILANCNHTIITYGTYGFWGAYIAGGEVVYFNNYLNPNTSFAKNEFIFGKMYPPRWIGITTMNISDFSS